MSSTYIFWSISFKGVTTSLSVLIMVLTVSMSDKVTDNGQTMALPCCIYINSDLFENYDLHTEIIEKEGIIYTRVYRKMTKCSSLPVL